MRCLGHVQISLRSHSYFSQNSLKSLSLYQSQYSFRVPDFLDQAHPFQNQGLSTIEDQRNFCWFLEPDFTISKRKQVWFFITLSLVSNLFQFLLHYHNLSLQTKSIVGFALLCFVLIFEQELFRDFCKLVSSIHQDSPLWTGRASLFICKFQFSWDLFAEAWKWVDQLAQLSFPLLFLFIRYFDRQSWRLLPGTGWCLCWCMGFPFCYWFCCSRDQQQIPSSHLWNGGCWSW